MYGVLALFLERGNAHLHSDSHTNSHTDQKEIGTMATSDGLSVRPDLLETCERQETETAEHTVHVQFTYIVLISSKSCEKEKTEQPHNTSGSSSR